MKQADAESEILRVWRDWNEPENKYDTHFGLLFYNWLYKNKAHLLSFRCAGDQYQVINAWVMRWQREYPQGK